MAEADSIRCCAHCGGQVFPRINKTTGQPSKAERRFCSNRCMWAARDARPWSVGDGLCSLTIRKGVGAYGMFRNLDFPSAPLQ